jgi:hypothetical protein
VLTVYIYVLLFIEHKEDVSPEKKFSPVIAVAVNICDYVRNIRYLCLFLSNVLQAKIIFNIRQSLPQIHVCFISTDILSVGLFISTED